MIRLLILISILTTCIATTNKRVLVILDHISMKDSYSKYLSALQQSGFQVDVKAANDASVKIFKYGDLLYDNLLIMAPNSETFGASVDVNQVLKFIDAGGNLLVAADQTVRDAVRSLANECGLEFDNTGNFVIDHFNYDESDEGRHVKIVASGSGLIDEPVIDGGLKNSAFLYQGIGLHLHEGNPLAFQVLKASEDAYSYSAGEKVKTFPFTVGSETTLIGAVQARNNARATFVGSLKFFSDEFFDANIKSASGSISAKSGNSQLAKSISEWTFQESGVLRVVDVSHKLKGADLENSNNSSGYTIKEDVTYSIKIEKYEKGEWKAFTADDMQLEFIRIDPFVRQTLSSGSNGVFSADFKIPDVYGVFTFTVNYRRIGYTYLYSRTQVTVRPFMHTQYERFIFAAYPYYASAFCMMLGAFGVSMFVLGTAEEDVLKGKQE